MDTWNRRKTMDSLHFATGAIGASEARILLGALLLACQSFIASYAYDCVIKCNQPASSISLSPDSSACLLQLPDNPRPFAPKPCQLLVHNNCTEGRVCQLQVQVLSFGHSRKMCSQKAVMTPDRCNEPDRCEYGVIEELSDETEVTQQATQHLLHGNVTDHSISINRDLLRISVCYSADTFTSRSTHIAFSSKDVTPNDDVDLGPTSVWILAGVVIILLVAILVIAKCSALDQYLNPAAMQQKDFMPLPKA